MTETDNQNEELGLHRIIDLDHFSNLRRLLRINAYVFRFIRNCGTEKKNRKATSLTVNEIQDATILKIKNV